jgi:hypothetical protein
MMNSPIRPERITATSRSLEGGLFKYQRANVVAGAALLVLFQCLSTRQVLAQGYVNVAAAQGLDFTIPVQPIDFGTGVSFHDFDGDGWDDLTFGNTNDSLIFYRNESGTLVRMPSPVFGAGDTKHVLWADVDNDGDSDLLVTTFNGPVRLFRNDGGWVFTDVTSTSGILQANANHYGASFGDYDRDGFLDLYVCTYIYSADDSYTYARINHLYHNDGDGTFTDVTLQAGVGNGLKATFQSVWMDVDVDGWPDLYIINDFAGANALYRNNGDGTFTDMALQLGLAETQEHCMSISLCDFDVDGDLDIFMTNTGIFPTQNNARSMLMVNDGAGVFTESSTLYGLDIFEWGWGSLWVDHNNDGYQDLYIATHRELQAPVANLFYRNSGGTSFSPGPGLFGGPQVASSHSVARGDINGDGYADIVVCNQAPFPTYLWQSQGGSAHHVRIGLTGTLSNRQGIGSWIRVYAGGKQYIHYTVCGEDYLGQSSPYVHFGLGSATVADSVEVEYLSGHVDRYYALAVDSLYRFTEGETFGVSIAAPNGTSACAPNTVVLDAGEHLSYLWSTGHTGRYLTVTATGTYQVTVGSLFGVDATSEPVQVQLFPAPSIVAQRSDPLCAGEASGSIVLTNLSGVGTASVAWSNGAQGPSPSALTAGVYFYDYEDVNGCTASGSVELMDPEALFVLVNTTPADDGDNGSISWTIFGGAPPYSVTLNGTPVAGNDSTGLAAGSYVCEVTDAAGCVETVNATVQGGVGIGDVDGSNGLSIHPNPTDAVLYIRASRIVQELRLFDLSGRALVTRPVGSTDAVLDLAAWAPGAYFVELRYTDGTLQRAQFVKE